MHGTGQQTQCAGAVPDVLIGSQKDGHPRPAGHLHLAQHGVPVVKEDKVGPGVPVHIGIVPGAQLPGEEHGGTQSVHLLAQLLPG